MQTFKEYCLIENKNTWIGVDLDGTLAHYTSFKGSTIIGKPILKMIDRVKKWVQKGKKVKIFTARADNPKAVKAIKKWLDKVGLPELEITNIKDHMMSELWDDRAIQVKKNTGEIINVENEMVEEGWRETAAATGMLGLSWLPGVQLAHAPEYTQPTPKTQYVQNVNKITPTIHSQSNTITTPKTIATSKPIIKQKTAINENLKDIIARTLWAEARGEGEKGIRAVATVLINRAKGNPTQLRKIIKPIQFSSWNKGIPVVKLRNKTDVEVWKLCQQISTEMITGKFKPLGSWTNFYNPSEVTPRWAKNVPYVTIGKHQFLKVNK